jgi:hypothetical protein
MTEIASPQAEGDCHFRSGDMEFDFNVELGTWIPRQAHPGTLVPDIDALAARLTEQGITIEWDDKFPGYRRFYARDPLGNRLQFLQQIPAGS